MMCKLRKTAVAAAALAALSLAGCSAPEFKTEYYTLTPDVDVRVPASSRYSHSLGIGPIKLPEMLEHTGIVSQNEQRVYVANFQVWAGDLKRAVSRVLADNLSSHLGTDEIWPFPWDNRIRPERQVSVVFEQFSGERGGEVVLQAKWRLLSENGSDELDSGKIRLRATTVSNSYGAYVSTLNALLNDFSAQLARELANEPLN